LTNDELQSLNDQEKIQLCVALVAAKFQSEKSEEICQFAVVNKILSSIIGSKFDDPFFRSFVDGYGPRVMPNSSYAPMITALANLISSSERNANSPELVEMVLSMCFPYSPDDDQIGELVELAIKELEADT